MKTKLKARSGYAPGFSKRFDVRVLLHRAPGKSFEACAVVHHPSTGPAQYKRKYRGEPLCAFATSPRRAAAAALSRLARLLPSRSSSFAGKHK